MNNSLKTGDLLYRSKGIVQHVGVYWGDQQVLHNQPPKGVLVTHYEEYAQGKSVKVIKINHDNQELLVTRLQEIMDSGNNYHLLANNCEHLANYLINGRKNSPQLQATLLCALAGGIVGSQSESNAWGKGIILGGLTGVLMCNLLRSYDHTVKPPY